MEHDNNPKAKGGHARAAILDADQRSDIARKAASARWKGDLPEATHDGELKIGDMSIPCAVLEDGSRVLTETDFMENMGMYRSGALSVRRKADPEAGAQVPLYLAFKNLKPFVDKHLGDVHLTHIKYRTPTGNIAHGISAELIPRICEVWLDANKAGVLGKRQLQIAEKAEIIIRALAHVGIIALVDEATGYQEIRDRRALQAILDRFLRKELAAWAKKFPDEFYKEMFRLRGWEWRGMKINRPSVVGKYTNDLVYDRIAPNLLTELENRNPKELGGRRKAKHHQWLTEDVGNPALAQHLHSVIGFMRASRDWNEFKRLMNRAYPPKGRTLDLDLLEVDQES